MNTYQIARQAMAVQLSDADSDDLPLVWEQETAPFRVFLAREMMSRGYLDGRDESQRVVAYGLTAQGKALLDPGVDRAPIPNAFDWFVGSFYDVSPPR